MSTFEGKFENEEQYIETQKKYINKELKVVSEVVIFLVLMLLCFYSVGKLIKYFKKHKKKDKI
jgi:hypothetical protein